MKPKSSMQELLSSIRSFIAPAQGGAAQAPPQQVANTPQPGIVPPAPGGAAPSAASTPNPALSHLNLGPMEYHPAVGLHLKVRS